MSDYLQVNLILKSGPAMSLTAAREDAERLVKQHAEGKLPPTIGTHNIRCRQDILAVSIVSASVEAVYLATPAPLVSDHFGRGPFAPLPPLDARS